MAEALFYTRNFFRAGFKLLRPRAELLLPTAAGQRPGISAKLSASHFGGFRGGGAHR